MRKSVATSFKTQMKHLSIRFTQNQVLISGIDSVQTAETKPLVKLDGDKVFIVLILH